MENEVIRNPKNCEDCLNLMNGLRCVLGMMVDKGIAKRDFIEVTNRLKPEACEKQELINELLK